MKVRAFLVARRVLAVSIRCCSNCSTALQHSLIHWDLSAARDSSFVIYYIAIIAGFMFTRSWSLYVFADYLGVVWRYSVGHRACAWVDVDQTRPDQRNWVQYNIDSMPVVSYCSRTLIFGKYHFFSNTFVTHVILWSLWARTIWPRPRAGQTKNFYDVLRYDC